jgi:E3 ubiquitin-protein ligase RNF115/126
MQELEANFTNMLGDILGPRSPISPRSQFENPRARDPQFDPFNFMGGRTTQTTTHRLRPDSPPAPQDLLGMLFGNVTAGPGGARTLETNGPFSPFHFLQHMFNPANATAGDAVFTQEALDRVISQLMEQHAGGNAPGPASPAAISALPQKKVDKTMLGNEGKAECSICMDSVELGSEVTELPCKHWFHGQCVSAWLREHDTCPHCRQGITTAHQSRTPQSPQAPSAVTPQPQDFGRASTSRGSTSRQRSYTTIDGRPIRNRNSDPSIPGAFPRPFPTRDPNLSSNPNLNHNVNTNANHNINTNPWFTPDGDLSETHNSGRQGSSSSGWGGRYDNPRAEREQERERERRRSSRDSHGNGHNNHNYGGGGITGWMRNHFGGGGS